MRKPDYDRRVVVTGLGVISSVGNDPRTAWSNLVNGVSGLVPVTRFDTTPYDAKWGGELPFTVVYGKDGRKLRTLSGMQSYADLEKVVSPLLK